jgi:hypothetical protein
LSHFLNYQLQQFAFGIPNLCNSDQIVNIHLAQENCL